MISPFRENTRLLLTPLLRRFYGTVLLLPAAVLFFILPENVPAGGIGLGGPPALFFPIAMTAFYSAALVLLFTLSFLSGRSTDSGLWLKHTGSLPFIFGKWGFGLLFPLLCTLPSFPVLLIAVRLEGKGGAAVPGFALYMTALFSAVTLLSEILNLLFTGRPVLRRIILWSLFLVQIIAAPRLAPFFSPAVFLERLILSGGSLLTIKPLIQVILIPPALFTAAVLLSGLRRSQDE